MKITNFLKKTLLASMPVLLTVAISAVVSAASGSCSMFIYWNGRKICVGNT